MTGAAAGDPEAAPPADLTHLGASRRRARRARRRRRGRRERELTGPVHPVDPAPEPGAGGDPGDDPAPPSGPAHLGKGPPDDPRLAASGQRRVRTPRAPRLRWWREVIYILAFYLVYSFIRNKGVATDSVGLARRHAVQIIDLERRLGSFHEESIQDWFLRWPAFVQFWNVFYGTAHFVVTVVALVYLFRRMSARYPLWRNTLAFTTGLALIGFAFYPLMPPRLMPDYGFVDTLKELGGLWSFDSGAVAKVSNQYAAMPSLHFAWSSWCAFVLYPALRRPWARALMVAYPFITLFAIVVTANHFWLDAVGGAVTLAAGFLLGRALTRFLAGRGRQPDPDPADEVDTSATPAPEGSQ